MPIYRKVFNEHYFSSVDTEDKAYWLGFLYADGCVFRKLERTYIGGNLIRTNRIDKLTLSSIDVEHLYKFKSSLDANNTVCMKAKKGREAKYGYIMFNSKKLCDDLERAGCTQKKSLTLRFPEENVVSSELQRHFIRGYFDGDGCISVRYNNNSNRTAYPRLTFLGTMKFLSVLRSILNVDYAIVNISKIWAMEIGSAINFNKVVRYMYDNSNIFLNRKKVMAYSYL